MSANFKVGEVAIGQHFIFDTHRNGAECEIVRGLHGSDVPHRTTGRCIQCGYGVLWSDGTLGIVRPHNLRRRNPPTTGEESVLALFKGVPQREGAPA